MEQLDQSVPRVKLILGRYPIIGVTSRLYQPGYDIRVRFHEISFIMTVPLDQIDVRVGDYATLYTDLPLKEVKNALTLPTPEQ